MDIRSYFRNASKSTVVSSSSDSEDGNESKIDVQPNPLRSIAQVLLLNHLHVRIWNQEIQQKVRINFSLVGV